MSISLLDNSLKVGIYFEESDRDFVRGIPDILDMAGYKIVKTEQD